MGNRVQVAVQALVRYHLAPALLCKNGASAKAYRRLLRKLLHADVSWELLLRVATADHLGRTTDEAKARRFPAGEVFKENMLAATAENPESQDVVKGRHLIARGLQPGAEFGKILARCRDIQDDTGSTRVDEILDRALDELLG